jgi:hypothetical protein
MMQRDLQSETGLGLIEAMIAMLVLTVGAVGMASTFLHGMHNVTGSPNELVATQKAAEAVESVYSARDSHTITWDQLRNAAYGGVFKNGPQPLKVSGLDGVINTSDDGEIESVTLPGPDQVMETPDDRVEMLNSFTREIQIRDVPNRTDLRTLTIIITYKSGATTQNYTLSTYISALT